jgi:hypothetical protein
MELSFACGIKRSEHAFIQKINKSVYMKVPSHAGTSFLPLLQYSQKHMTMIWFKYDTKNGPNINILVI